MPEESYDYIIAGGGLAGLSLANLLDNSSLRDRRVLIIDRETKAGNDHTWCFWASGESPFEDIVFHRWRSLTIWPREGGKIGLDLDSGDEQLEYRMIRSSDLYGRLIPRLKENPSISFLTSEVRSVGNGTVETDAGVFAANELVFDSVTRGDYSDPGYTNLLQHFVGWEIETAEPVFDLEAATLFDFRVEQSGGCRFVYVLPFSPTRALVEFTVFSSALLDEAEYENHLETYLSRVMNAGEFELIARERGVIPMSDVPHEMMPDPKTVRIGTAGGFVKPSTGYSFSRAQRTLAKMVRNLEEGRPFDEGADRSNWKRFLDSVLLDVLHRERVAPPEVFTRLFRNNEPSRMMRFLDEQTSLREDLVIMSTVQLGAFTHAAAAVLARNFRNAFRR